LVVIMLVKLFCLSTLIGLLVLGGYLVVNLNEPVRHVVIRGNLSDAERAEVQSSISSGLDASLMNLDLDGLKDQIAGLTWPRSVAIRRIWPDRLEVMVEKEMVVARWSDGGYVTSAGAIVSQPDEAGPLPLFSCDLSSPAQAMEVYQMLKDIMAREGLVVTTLDENAFGEWRVSVKGGLEVVLGAEHITQRLHRFLLAYRRVVAAQIERIDYVDARYPNGIAIRWREPTLELARVTTTTSQE
jgi:cell division protein FtsQ